MYDKVFIRLEIWPEPPDDRWWNAFLEMARKREVTFAVDPTPDGIVAMADQTLAVKSVVLAVDSAIEYANDSRRAQLGESQTELDRIADELEKPDPRK